MTTLAPKPDWAPSIWKDSRGNLYAQFGQSVLRFDLTDGGLGKLLKLIPTIESQPGYVTGRRNIVDHVLKKPIKVAKTTERKRLLNKFSKQSERRAMYQEMIRRSGIKESK